MTIQVTTELIQGAHDTDSAAIAATIHDQLGGCRFDIVTGAQHFMIIKNGLTFRVPNAMGRIKSVRITLHADDTYEMSFHRANGDVASRAAGIHNADMGRVFTQATGLYLSL